MDDYLRIKHAIEYLLQQRTEQPNLTDLAAELHLSESHLQRLFTRWAGVSPKRFLQYLNLEQAKPYLQAGASILETSDAIGLSSASRLYDLCVSITAATPGEIKSQGLGIHIRYGWGETPYGFAFVASSSRGICQLRFSESQENDLKLLLADWPQASVECDNFYAHRLLQSVFSTKPEQEQALSLWLKGSNFQLQVWQALLHLPYGTVCSYQQLAVHMNKPTASRAVASAVARNSVAYLIPCHRVIRSSGALGGYRWGLPRKQLMLARELAQD